LEIVVPSDSDKTDAYTTMVEPETQTFQEHVAGNQRMINDGSIWLMEGCAAG
jgi:hypothetical protein